MAWDSETVALILEWLYQEGWSESLNQNLVRQDSS